MLQHPQEHWSSMLLDLQTRVSHALYKQKESVHVSITPKKRMLRYLTARFFQVLVPPNPICPCFHTSREKSSMLAYLFRNWLRNLTKKGIPCFRTYLRGKQCSTLRYLQGSSFYIVSPSPKKVFCAGVIPKMVVHAPALPEIVFHACTNPKIWNSMFSLFKKRFPCGNATNTCQNNQLCFIHGLLVPTGFAPWMSNAPGVFSRKKLKKVFYASVFPKNWDNFLCFNCRLWFTWGLFKDLRCFCTTEEAFHAYVPRLPRARIFQTVFPCCNAPKMSE